MTESSFYTSSTLSLHNSYPAKIFVQPSTECISKPTCEICSSSSPLYLLKCMSCAVSVHSTCYQIETYQDPWQCQRCMLELFSKEKAECLACKQSSGAMRLHPEGWLHVLCGSWPSYQNFSDSQCLFCKKAEGFFLNCEKCLKIFHPFCGFLAGLRNFEGIVACSEHFGQSQGQKQRGRKKNKNLKNQEKENIEPVQTACQDPKKRKRTKKLKGRRKITGNLSEPFSHCKKSKIPINWQGSQEQLLQRFEDFLFKTSEVSNSGYLLNSSLQGLLNLSEIRFKDLPSVLSLFN